MFLWKGSKISLIFTRLPRRPERYTIRNGCIFSMAIPLFDCGISYRTNFKLYYFGFFDKMIGVAYKPDGYRPLWEIQDEQREKIIVLSDRRRKNAPNRR